jgi:hypothetical protein
MHKNATKCNETIGKWCKNKHGASKIIDTFETYQRQRATASTEELGGSSSEASRSRSSRKGEIHWAELSSDGDDRRRGRRIPVVRRKHIARRSRCTIGQRRSSPELAGIGRGTHQRFGIARGGLGLGHDRAGERVRGSQLGQAGPVKPTRVDWPVGPGCQPSLFIWFNSKKPKKNPNLLKINSKKT